MTAFEEYIDQYGPHFSKRLYEWAVSMIRDRNGGKVAPMTKEQVDEFLKARGVTLKGGKGHDVAYVYQMARADYYGSSITDDTHLAMFVRDYIDDPDGSPAKAFDHFVVDCKSKGEPVFWDDMI